MPIDIITDHKPLISVLQAWQSNLPRPPRQTCGCRGVGVLAYTAGTRSSFCTPRTRCKRATSFPSRQRAGPGSTARLRETATRATQVSYSTI
eukprot:scaffold48665_cov18-Prasinocladus_malaysianus.AAC.1